MTSRTEIEKKLIESKDLLQIQYLKDYNYSKNEVLIIQSNRIIASTLQKYLTKLGFEKIYLCTSASDGLDIFKDLTAMNKTIPVILDDNMPDKSVRDIIRDMLNVNSGTSIIVNTAGDKSDPTIKELLNIGIFSLLSKPLRFNELEEVINALRDEHELTDNKKILLQRKFENLLNANKKISFQRITNFIGNDINEIGKYINDLETRGKIISLGKINEIACNQCNSVMITQTAKCPKCNGINFKHQNLIEHYRCNNIFPKSDSDKCPKCNKKLGKIGIDYGELDNYFVCNGCSDKFPEPLFEFECRQCENKFEKNQANWEKSTYYKIFGK